MIAAEMLSRASNANGVRFTNRDVIRKAAELTACWALFKKYHPTCVSLCVALLTDIRKKNPMPSIVGEAYETASLFHESLWKTFKGNNRVSSRIGVSYKMLCRFNGNDTGEKPQKFVSSKKFFYRLAMGRHLLARGGDGGIVAIVLMLVRDGVIQMEYVEDSSGDAAASSSNSVLPIVAAAAGRKYHWLRLGEECDREHTGRSRHKPKICPFPFHTNIERGKLYS